MKNKILTTLFFAIIFLGGGYLFAMFSEKNDAEVESRSQSQIQSPDVTSSDQNNSPAPAEDAEPVQMVEPDTDTTANVTKTIKQNVPFIVQAPFGNWDDPIFQNACEEASIVMAIGWVNSTKIIEPIEAKKQILDIVGFENKTFGYNTDTDAFDVQKIFKQYFKHENISVKENIAISDIKDELQKGNIVIVPAFGQALGNPNYTSPGPIAHMLVIIGYDSDSKEFITNDPGTRRGSDYRYGEKVLFNAIWSYPSGKDVPPAPTRTLKKVMVIVQKQ